MANDRYPAAGGWPCLGKKIMSQKCIIIQHLVVLNSLKASVPWCWTFLYIAGAPFLHTKESERPFRLLRTFPGSNFLRRTKSALSLGIACFASRCATALSCCFPRTHRHKATNGMSFCEIDLAAFHRASGEKPVFTLRASLESDDSDVVKNAMRLSTVIEIGQVSYLCDETPFVSQSALLNWQSVC